MTNSHLERIEEVTSLNGYAYRVWEYQASLSQLTIRATHPDKPKHNIHIVFYGVRYFQMPFYWEAGDFRLGSDDERRAVAKRVGVDDCNANSFFKAETPDTVVYIIGTIVAVLQDVEPVY
jgi:hypothetical protein